MKKQHYFLILLTLIIIFFVVYILVYHIAKKDVTVVLNKLRTDMSLKKYELRYKGISFFWGDKILEKQYVKLRYLGKNPVCSLVFSAKFQGNYFFQIE